MARLFWLAVAFSLSAGAHEGRDMELVGARPAGAQRLPARHPAAGRAVDIRDPYRPVEVAHFIPEGNPLTNNVEVDSRGYIYIVDRGSLGMHILALTGEARKVANWR